MPNEIKEVLERTLQDINADYQNACAAVGHNHYLLGLADKVKQNAENDVANLKAEIAKATEKLDQLNAEARELAAKAQMRVGAAVHEVKTETQQLEADAKKVL